MVIEPRKPKDDKEEEEMKARLKTDVLFYGY